MVFLSFNPEFVWRYEEKLRKTLWRYRPQVLDGRNLHIERSGNHSSSRFVSSIEEEIYRFCNKMVPSTVT
jgi:hypothetical protein